MISQQSARCKAHRVSPHGRIGWSARAPAIEARKRAASLVVRHARDVEAALDKKLSKTVMHRFGLLSGKRG